MDSLTSAGLPSLSSVYSNIHAPSTADLGGSLGDKATNLSNESTNAFNAYKNYADSLPNVGTTYQDLEKQNGIPQLQQTSNNLQGSVNDLENSIYRVTPNVTANTGNSLATNSQREGMIAAQELPMQMALTPQANSLAAINNDISTAQQNVQGQVNAQNTQNTNQLGVGAMGVSTAQQNQAMQMSGYTTDEDNQLQGLLKKLDIEGTLDNSEWQTLSTLATNKQSYQQALGKIQQTNQFQTVGNNLVNTLTGQIINPGILTGSKGVYQGS
jgi:hypothetical protein